MKVRILFESEIRKLIDPAGALAAVREAFIQLARGKAVLPGVLHLDLPQSRGEVHVKGAWLEGASCFSIKEASGFYGNPEKGLPVGAGVMLLFDASTGFLRSILFDNGYLTELRTGAAGALAAELLARRSARSCGILGAGVQARYQLEALLGVRHIGEVRVHSRSRAGAAAYAREMQARFGLPVFPCESAREAVAGAEIVITATPSRAPLVETEWIAPGTHITAMGSDGPGKQELPAALLARAGKVVADRLEQCLRFGEIHHAVVAGVMEAGGVHAELGHVAAGLAAGRENDEEITIADLTGVGVQDAAAANYVFRQAEEKNVGSFLEV